MNSKLIYYFRKWADISEEAEGIILSAFEPSSVKKKKDLLEPGEVCQYLYSIVKGEVEVDRSKYDVRYGSNSFFGNLGDNAISDIFTLDIALVL